MEDQRKQRHARGVSLDDPRPLSLLFRLSLPAMIGLLVNILYTMVDMVFVGQAVGPVGIAALGISLGGYLVLTGAALMMGVGGASLVSRHLGAKQIAEAGRTARISISGMCLISLTLGTVGLLFFRPLAYTLGSDAETFPLVRSYLGVLLAGAPFLTISTVLQALLRSQGKAKEAMSASIIGNVVNILLDFLFIIILDWGVLGASIATVFGQTSSALFAFRVLCSPRSAFSLKKETGRPYLQVFWRIVAIGSPTLMRQLGTGLVTIVVNRSLLMYGNTLSIAAYGIIWNLLMFFTMPVSGIVQGFQPIVGYQAGAKRYALVSRVLKASFLITFLLGVFFLLLVMFVPSFFLQLFTHDQLLLKEARAVARILLVSLPFLGIQSIGTAFFQAVGRAIPALIFWIVRQFVLLIPLILLFGKQWGASGIYLAFPLTDLICGSAIFLLALHHLRSMQREKVEQPSS
ncbi:MAG: MATE family efflux transporter [Sphaerochaeta sp.]